MRAFAAVTLSLACWGVVDATSLHLEHLDPVKLQTRTSPDVQAESAAAIIHRYETRVDVEVVPLLFQQNKDVFSLSVLEGRLRIRASSGVAAVWGFNYYLKKYLGGHLSWRIERMPYLVHLPVVNETVTANDRFRYYQNVCTASYSFAWWDIERWQRHVDWMALNGVNLALAPAAAEAAWAAVFRRLGLADDDLERQFTGPAFLAWLRMGNIRGWGGPLPESWHRRQRELQLVVTDYMSRLGMVPVLPAFAGHVPHALAAIYPNVTFHRVDSWNKFGNDYCCALYLDPRDPLFERLGRLFLEELTRGTGLGHVYAADPFNEVQFEGMTTDLVRAAAVAIVSAMRSVDNDAVWLLQNWMFVHDPLDWSLDRVRALLEAPPPGRLLVLDLQAEQWPQYNLYEMYYGRPFIWCMLHNFGGTLGMFGDMARINRDVYAARVAPNSTMIGVGLTPEGIYQNYVVYEMMLESAWRPRPISDLDRWTADYAKRRYGCDATAAGWRHLLRSVYSSHGDNRVRGKYAVTRRPSLRIRPWSWYGTYDLMAAWRSFVSAATECSSPGFEHDLVDVTRQALQYRTDQLYVGVRRAADTDPWALNATSLRFLDALEDMRRVLTTNRAFSAAEWLQGARAAAANSEEAFLYEMNARYQITLWGPNGEVEDYACKQWAEVLHHYYIPRWRAFLEAAVTAEARGARFDERAVQDAVRASVEAAFLTADIDYQIKGHAPTVARQLYEKWAFAPGLEELPPAWTRGAARTRPPARPGRREDYEVEPSVLMLYSTTPNQ